MVVLVSSTGAVVLELVSLPEYPRTAAVESELVSLSEYPRTGTIVEMVSLLEEPEYPTIQAKFAVEFTPEGRKIMEEPSKI